MPCAIGTTRIAPTRIAGLRGSTVAAVRNRFAQEVRSAGPDPQPRDVRGLARRAGDRCAHDRSEPVRPLERIRRLQRRRDGHSAVDRVVCELRRGARGRARQGEGRLAAADQDGVDGQARPDLRRDRAGAGDGLAQGRCRPGGEGRGHSDRRRGDRGRRLCRRVGHHRRVRARAEGAGHGHVLVGDRGHLADFRFACSFAPPPIRAKASSTA